MIDLGSGILIPHTIHIKEFPSQPIHMITSNQEIGFWRGEFDRSIQNETQKIYYHTQTSQNQMQQLMDIKNKYSSNQVRTNSMFCRKVISTLLKFH